MTFSHNIKKEIIGCYPENYRQAISELIGIIISFGKYDENKFGLIASLDNKSILNYVENIINKFFLFTPYSIKRDVSSRNNTYSLNLYNYFIYRILYNFSKYDSRYLFDNRILDYHSFVKGIFLGCGSISNPNDRYHLEFIIYRDDLLYKINSIFNDIGLNSKIISRKQRFIIYIKEADSISEFLKIIGTHKSVLEFEDIRVEKEYSNNKNRIKNCIEANEDKLIIASVRHVRAIMFIDEKIGLDNLPDKLKEIAEIRMKYKGASLKELGMYLNPPIGKSGVLHRLKKIEEIAHDIENKLKS